MKNTLFLGVVDYLLIIKFIVTLIFVCISIYGCSTGNILTTDIVPTKIIAKNAVAANQTSNIPVFSKQSPHTSMTEDGKYRITLYSNIFPIPLQKIHSWPLHIEYANGKPLLKAKIYIHGGMPEHRHEFPTVPRVRKNFGNGDFLIEGLKFNMQGDWELRINIKEEKQRDRVVFQIRLAP